MYNMTGVSFYVPQFNGGLTASAIRLKDAHPGVDFGDYDDTAVLYMGVDTMKNVFKFSINEDGANAIESGTEVHDGEINLITASTHWKYYGAGRKDVSNVENGGPASGLVGVVGVGDRGASTQSLEEHVLHEEIVKKLLPTYADAAYNAALDLLKDADVQLYHSTMKGESDAVNTAQVNRIATHNGEVALGDWDGVIDTFHNDRSIAEYLFRQFMISTGPATGRLSAAVVDKTGSATADSVHTIPFPFEENDEIIYKCIVTNNTQTPTGGIDGNFVEGTDATDPINSSRVYKIVIRLVQGGNGEALAAAAQASGLTIDPALDGGPPNAAPELESEQEPEPEPEQEPELPELPAPALSVSGWVVEEGAPNLNGTYAQIDSGAIGNDRVFVSTVAPNLKIEFKVKDGASDAEWHLTDNGWAVFDLGGGGYPSETQSGTSNLGVAPIQVKAGMTEDGNTFTEFADFHASALADASAGSVVVTGTGVFMGGTSADGDYTLTDGSGMGRQFDNTNGFRIVVDTTTTPPLWGMFKPISNGGGGDFLYRMGPGANPDGVNIKSIFGSELGGTYVTLKED